MTTTSQDAEFATAEYRLLLVSGIPVVRDGDRFCAINLWVQDLAARKAGQGRCSRRAQRAHP